MAKEIYHSMLAVSIPVAMADILSLDPMLPQNHFLPVPRFLQASELSNHKFRYRLEKTLCLDQLLHLVRVSL